MEHDEIPQADHRELQILPVSNRNRVPGGRGRSHHLPDRRDERGGQDLDHGSDRLLKEGDSAADVVKILDLSDREAARVLNRMESLENSDAFLIKPLLDEALGLKAQIKQLEGISQVGVLTPKEVRTPTMAPQIQ